MFQLLSKRHGCCAVRQEPLLSPKHNATIAPIALYDMFRSQHGRGARISARKALARQVHRAMAAQVALPGAAVVAEREEEVEGVQGSVT